MIRKTGYESVPQKNWIRISPYKIQHLFLFYLCRSKLLFLLFYYNFGPLILRYTKKKLLMTVPLSSTFHIKILKDFDAKKLKTLMLKN